MFSCRNPANIRNFFVRRQLFYQEEHRLGVRNAVPTEFDHLFNETAVRVCAFSSSFFGFNPLCRCLSVKGFVRPFARTEHLNLRRAQSRLQSELQIKRNKRKMPLGLESYER